MKLEDAVVILVCCSCLAKVNIGVDETQAMSTIELTSSIDKSGRLAVCWNETIVYQCRSVDFLAWNIEHQDRMLFLANQSGQCVAMDRGHFFAQNNRTADDYFLSHLTIPYDPEWFRNGTEVQCMHGPVHKELLYVITGSPTPPSHVRYNVTGQHVTLHWDTNTTCGIDCHTTMIAVDGDIMLNTSYQAGTAVIDVSKYHSNDSIAVKMYGINRCGMVSTNYTEKTVELDTHSATGEKGNSIKVKDIALGVSIPGTFLMLIALTIGAFLGSLYTKHHTKRKNNKNGLQIVTIDEVTSESSNQGTLLPGAEAAQSQTSEPSTTNISTHEN